jgi:tetratricopeptide (TPR) repeat protein
VVCLLAPSTAVAASLGPNDAFRSFSDLQSQPPASTITLQLPGFRAALCPPSRARPGRPVGKLGVATRAAEKVLRRGKSRKAYAKLLKRKAPAAEAFAVAGLAKGSAGAALAGFMAAHKKEPKNALHLVNASVMLAQAGKPAEAVALAKAALKARRPSAPPLGLSTKALALNAQGFALFHLRRYAEAARVLRQAVAAEPLLREAKINLAAALLCTGRASEAEAAYQAGQRRNSYSGPGALGEVTRADGTRSARPEDVLDMSQGQDGTLPPVTLPRTPADGAAAYKMFDQLSQQRQQQADDLKAEYDRLFDAFLASGATTNAQTFHRTAAIGLYALEWMIFRPELKQLYDELQAYHGQVLELSAAFSKRHQEIADSCSGQPTSAANHQCRYSQCGPELASRHQDWLRIAQAQDAAIHKWAAGLHKYATAVAANVSNAASHQMVTKSVLYQVYGFYDALYLDTIAGWTLTPYVYKADCIEEPGTGEGETGPESLPPSLACPEALKLVSFNLSLPLPDGLKLDLSLKCESVTLGVSSELPLTPFAEIDFNFQGASTTLFVGGRGSTGSLGADGGVYVSFNSSGSVTDIGIKGSAGGSESAGPVQLGGAAWEGQVSLAPYVLGP